MSIRCFAGESLGLIVMGEVARTVGVAACDESAAFTACDACDESGFATLAPSSTCTLTGGSSGATSLETTTVSEDATCTTAVSGGDCAVVEEVAHAEVAIYVLALRKASACAVVVDEVESEVACAVVDEVTNTEVAWVVVDEVAEAEVGWAVVDEVPEPEVACSVVDEVAEVG